MKIIVAGAGEVGTHLARMLSRETHDITVVDPDQKNLDNVAAHADLVTICGSSTSFAILKEAGVRSCDLFIAVAPTEEINLASAMIAKRLGAKKTIARINNQEYLQPINKPHFIAMGIDSMIYPQKLAAREIVNLLDQTGTSEIFNFSSGKLSLFVLKLDETAPVINKTLIEASIVKEKFLYRAVAITRNGKTIIPRGHDRFLVNDLVYVITNQEGIKKMMKYSGVKKLDINKLIILGGSRTGIQTALELQKSINIKLIESDPEKAQAIAEQLTHTLVINDDARNVEMLIEEGLETTDAILATTGNSETNIISCIHAKRLGVKKTIASVENIDYIDLVENMGIDAIINKKLIAASYIFRFTLDADVPSVVCLTGADAEVLEFVVRDGARITKAPLLELDFPKDAIIGGVVRGAESFIAKGDTVFLPNDRVVVFALPLSLQKVQNFFN